MIYVITKMTVMPKSCAECDLRRKSRFTDSEACNETGESTHGYAESRPMWCPLKEMEARNE